MTLRLLLPYSGHTPANPAYHITRLMQDISQQNGFIDNEFKCEEIACLQGRRKSFREERGHGEETEEEKNFFSGPGQSDWKVWGQKPDVTLAAVKFLHNICDALFCSS